jgi:hypothetical protein
MLTSGALVFVMSVLRITVVRLKETPKYLLGLSDDAQVVETLQFLAKKYDRPMSLTLDKLEACGEVRGAHSKNRFSANEFMIHLRGLFATRQIGISTVLIWVSWTLIGLVYPLFYVFLPYVFFWALEKLQHQPTNTTQYLPRNPWSRFRRDTSKHIPSLLLSRGFTRSALS